MPAEATRDEIAAEIHDMAALNIQERLAELRQAMPQLDLAEIEARNHLDDIIGRRTRMTALIVDLDQLVDRHFATSNPAPAEVGSSPEPATNVAAAIAPDPTPAPTVDRYERAAACARAAHAAGQPMNVALLEAGFAGTHASAQQFLTVLRKRGHDIPSGRTRNTPPRPRHRHPAHEHEAAAADRGRRGLQGRRRQRPQTHHRDRRPLGMHPPRSQRLGHRSPHRRPPPTPHRTRHPRWRRSPPLRPERLTHG